MLRFLASFLGAVVLSSLPAAGNAARAGGSQALNSYTAVHCDLPVCNCSSAPATQMLCYESGFEIEIGGEPVIVRTGFSSTECLTVTILPGKCVEICYVYRVIERCSSWWWGCTYNTVLLRTYISEYEAGCAPASLEGIGGSRSEVLLAG